MTYYEIKKVFAKKGSKLALLFLILVLIFDVVLIVGEERFVNEEGVEEKGLSVIAAEREARKVWAGELTEEVIRKVIEENQKYVQDPRNQSESTQDWNLAYRRIQGLSEIRNLLIYSYGSFNEYDYRVLDSLSPDRADEFYENRIGNLKTWLETDAKSVYTEKEKEFLVSRYEELKTPIKYDYQAGWKNLFSGAPMILMLTTIALGILCSGIFSDEIRLKADAVYFSSYHGRNRAVWAKVAAGFWVVTIVYWAVLLLYTAIVLGIFGAGGAQCPIQSLMSGWKSFYNITNIQRYLLMIFGGYLGCLFMLLFVMLISAKTNSAVLAVIMPFAMIFLPSFLSNINHPIIEKILGVLPDRLLVVSESVKFFDLYEIFGKVMGAVPLLFVIYGTLSVIMIPAIYFGFRKKQVN